MKRTPLKRKSAKQLVKDAAWREARELALTRDNDWPVCPRYQLPGGCRGGLHVHHIRRRSQGGGNELSNLVTLCSFHHDWVHTHVAEAVELGLLARAEVAS